MLGGRVFFRWQSRKHVIVVKLLGKLLDQSALTDPVAALHNDERRRFLPRRFSKPVELRLPADKFRHGSPWKCKSTFVDGDFHVALIYGVVNRQMLICTSESGRPQASLTRCASKNWAIRECNSN